MDSVMVKLKIIIILTLIVITCFQLSNTTCLSITTSLYCSNLGNGTENKSLILQKSNTSHRKDVQMIFLQSCSGSIEEDTFSQFPNMKSLDIQFSNISHFSPKSNTMNVLYIMNNFKFPKVSADFLNICCKNVSTLIIVNNHGLQIDKGTFKYMTNLTHLTISQQNITDLTSDFFGGLKQLTYLNLKDNGILNVNENTFQKMREINHLILSNNNLTKLEPKTFNNLKVLETIEMYDVNLTEFDISIFDDQKELRMLGLSKTLIKMENMKLNELTKAFPKLEYFGFLNTDSEDVNVAKFITKCKASGYNIRYT